VIARELADVKHPLLYVRVLDQDMLGYVLSLANREDTTHAHPAR